MGSHFPHPAWFKVIPFSDCQGCNQYYDDSAMFMSMLFVSSNTLILGGRYVSDYYTITSIIEGRGGAGVNLILPHSGSQKRQNWDEVKCGKIRQINLLPHSGSQKGKIGMR